MAMFDGITGLAFGRKIHPDNNHACAYHSLCINDDHTDYLEVIDDAQVTYIYFTNSGVEAYTCNSHANRDIDEDGLTIINKQIDKYPSDIAQPIFKW